MGRDYGWRDGGDAAGMAVLGVVSGDGFGLLFINSRSSLGIEFLSDSISSWKIVAPEVMET